jgi:uncharacterized membrane protein
MSRKRIATSLTLLLAYSLSVHLGVLSGHTLPALILLGGVFSLAIIASGRRILLLIVPLILYLLLSWRFAAELILLPPILINLTLAIVFGSTLVPGATPLITQFSRIMKGDLDAKAIRYTRQVTIAWVVFFCLIAIETVALTLYASPFVWSLFTNFLNYLFLFLFFFFEYLLRIRRFTEVEHLSFIDFMLSLTKVDLKCIKTF